MARKARKIRDVMRPNPQTLEATATVTEAAKLMDSALAEISKAPANV